MRYAYAPDELRPDSPLAAAGGAGAGVGVGLSIGGGYRGRTSCHTASSELMTRLLGYKDEADLCEALLDDLGLTTSS